MLITLLVIFGALLLLNDGISVASENITNDTTLLNTTNITSDLNTTAEQDIQAAGETTSDSSSTTLKDQYNNAHGIWIRSDDIAQINVTALVNAGITDVFVKVSRLVDYQTTLNSLAEVKTKLSSSGIRIHAWITCFKDANGNWVDPQGVYMYTVQVPYQNTVKVAYKQWYKGWYKKYYTKLTKKWYKYWYKSGSKWKYKWKYTWKKVTKYYKKYGWYSVWKYKYVTQTDYKTENRWAVNSNFNDQLVQFTTNLASATNLAGDNLVDGIHLDYIRYPGTAYKYTGGTTAITNFVARVNTAVKSVNSNVALSAALMPEGSINAYFYGQDYSQLANYLDFMVPMIYKGNYEQNTTWIGTKTAYIVSKAGDTPVIVGLQTYVSDSNLTPLSAAELNQDINKAIECGASGYVLFRLGLIDTNFLAGSDFDAASAGSVSASASSETTDSNAVPMSFPIAASNYSVALQQYLQSTANCQSTDSQIIALAQSITVNATSSYEMAQFIFNWVRDEVEYSFYYNTKYGAVNTMLNRAGNCVDLSHLIVALCRAAGIPALYKHGTCNFASGTYGHVWAQVYVNGNWINADASNNANSFGIITNWDTSSYTLKGTYASLPF